MIRKKIISLAVMSMFSCTLMAQPYLDVINAGHTTTQGAGTSHRNEIVYRNLSINAPLKFTPVHGLVVISPFYEECTIAAATSLGSEMHHNYALAFSFVDTVSTHTWRYAVTPLIRVKDLSKDGTSSAQMGVAGLAIFHKNESLTYKFGFYFNRYYFGDFFVPLVGVDWWINKQNKLFGVLPGNMTFEHKVSRSFYYGIAFKAVTDAYKDENKKYLRIDDNQLGLFADTYLAKNIMINAEFGRSFFRKWRTGEKNVSSVKLDVVDSYYVKVSLAYRIRFTN